MGTNIDVADKLHPLYTSTWTTVHSFVLYLMNSVLMVLHNFRGGTPSERTVLIVLHNHNFREGYSTSSVP